jgi:hypothetical protein
MTSGLFLVSGIDLTGSMLLAPNWVGQAMCH